ncbi:MULTISPECIES: PaaI family thioesterase [Streptomyces]|uniref:PaaI family thioesterase n=1 Tax=Streptomyces TaxID=1883 RepID=UPI00099D2765|nr:PaaI family thioesterase [Streptomyces virginiae]
MESQTIPGYDGTLGIQYVEVKPDRVEAFIDIDSRHLQLGGIVHGGVYASIVESLGSVGAALWGAPRQLAPVGVANSTDFLAMHREGRLTAIGEPIQQSLTYQLWLIKITGRDDRDVARGQLRLHHLRGRNLPTNER